MKTVQQRVKWKKEILETERAFAEMVANEGLHKAFTTFAADDAVLLRNNELIAGKEAIDTFYEGHDSKGLSWIPDQIDVAVSGDLAYTYGHYTYTYTDKDGNPQESTGVFHTVWKRQRDGKWKYVWD
jgi:ketosteroid isomerase-like protein